MPRLADIRSIFIGACLLGLSARGPATPPPEPVDWAAQLPPGTWVLGAAPWVDRSACDHVVCNAGLNASPLLIDVRFVNSQFGRQLSLHGSVVDCLTIFQRFLALDDLSAAQRQAQFEALLSQMVSDMRAYCSVSEHPALPPLSLSQLISNDGQ